MSCPGLAQMWPMAGALDDGSGGCMLVVVVVVDVVGLKEKLEKYMLESRSTFLYLHSLFPF